MTDERRDYNEVEENLADFVEPWNDGYREETAAEISDVRSFEKDEIEEDEDFTSNAGSGAGMFAIVLSILSLFFLPILLGVSGIIVGFISRRMGATTLGNWAIGIGAVSIILKVFFSPFF